MLFRFRVDYSLTRLMDNDFSRGSRVVEAQSKTQAENRLHEQFIDEGFDYYADVHRVVVIEEERMHQQFQLLLCMEEKELDVLVDHALFFAQLQAKFFAPLKLDIKKFVM